jgi:hypothetical protein
MRLSAGDNLLSNTHDIFKAYRATDYESVGRQFESVRAYQTKSLFSPGVFIPSLVLSFQS